jgi:hypothetical protein
VKVEIIVSGQGAFIDMSVALSGETYKKKKKKEYAK